MSFERLMCRLPHPVSNILSVAFTTVVKRENIKGLLCLFCLFRSWLKIGIKNLQLQFVFCASEPLYKHCETQWAKFLTCFFLTKECFRFYIQRDQRKKPQTIGSLSWKPVDLQLNINPWPNIQKYGDADGRMCVVYVFKLSVGKTRLHQPSVWSKVAPSSIINLTVPFIKSLLKKRKG